MTNQNSKMSEVEKSKQGQKPKTSKVAIASVVLVILGFVILPFSAVTHPAPSRAILARNVWGLLMLGGLVLGIVGLLQIKKSGGTLKGRGFAVVATVLAVIFFGVWFSDQILHDYSGRRAPCGANLKVLGTAMLMYAYDYDGRYPAADKWCDLLIESDYGVSEKHFVCPRLVLYWPLVGGEMFVWPSAQKGRCHYAMNPNCRPNSALDIVLLFETKEGWNQFGGPEILTTENHRPKGCNVLFNDGSIRFVKTEQLGELKWKVEEANSIE